MELLDDRERRAKDVLGNVSHRDIVRQSDLVANALKLSAASKRQHSKCKGAAETESRAASGEPEPDFVLETRGPWAINFVSFTDKTSKLDLANNSNWKATPYNSRKGVYKC